MRRGISSSSSSSASSYEPTQPSPPDPDAKIHTRETPAPRNRVLNLERGLFRHSSQICAVQQDARGELLGAREGREGMEDEKNREQSPPYPGPVSPAQANTRSYPAWRRKPWRWRVWSERRVHRVWERSVGRKGSVGAEPRIEGRKRNSSFVVPSVVVRVAVAVAVPVPVPVAMDCGCELCPESRVQTLLFSTRRLQCLRQSPTHTHTRAKLSVTAVSDGQAWFPRGDGHGDGECWIWARREDFRKIIKNRLRS